MFGITPPGWVHTLGSLPAIPAAAYMLCRHGRIVPRSLAGTVYLVCMLIGSGTVFLVAREPVGYAIGGLTLLLLIAGYAAGRAPLPARAGRYLETICLTLTVFLLMLPTVTETLTRVPDGHPLVTDLHAPLLMGVQGSLLIILIVGLAAQILHLRKLGRNMAL